MPTLSKSKFVSGCQCSKKLFFDVFRDDLKTPVSEQQQALYDTGHLVGSLAQQVYPGGSDATQGLNGNDKWAIAIQRTNDWIKGGLTTIYEAAFSSPGVFAALDILHHHQGERYAIEVKSSTSVKEYHVTDASFQYFVMKAAGYAPDKFYLMHINNMYMKKGPINPQKLFVLQDITQQVLDNQSQIQEKSRELLQMLQRKQEPTIEIGPHCSSPFSCNYLNHCRSHLPEQHVFELYNPKGKDWELYRQGILSLADVPDDEPLNKRQELQIRGVKYNENHIDKDQVVQFLSGIKGPVYFFDFETINPAVPVLNGTRPFEQVPFQYSLHQTDVDGNIVKSAAFLADPADFSDQSLNDPRWLLIQQIKKDIGPEGSIIAYNASFEINILKRLAESYPDEQSFIESLINRFVDLLQPFKNGWYYLPAMGASASIKSVLPAISPEFSYQDLPINNGGVASETFHVMIKGGYADKTDEIRSNLLQYCDRDTEGMVVLYRALRDIPQ
jgi:hypothetical protein